MNVDHVGTAAEALFQDDILCDPHSFLAKLRTHEPVARVEDAAGRVFCLVSSYQLIEEVSQRSDEFSSDIGHLLMGDSGDPEVTAILAQDYFSPTLLLCTDDPAHKRYRSLVNLVFSAGRIGNMAPAIGRLVNELIDGFIARGEVDFVNEFAVLLPTYVIADVLGLPRESYGLLRKWSDSVIRIVSRMGTHEEQLEAAHDIVELRRFIMGTVRARRQKREDDLISKLIDACVEDFEPLTDDEIASLSFEVSVAGNETTRNTLMSGIIRLLVNPDQLAALKADPSLVANAVEELLRYETPATSMWRIATRRTELAGMEIPAGMPLLLRFDAGNRDSAIFEDPDKFDILRRNARRHQSFGGGSIHRCLGQMLARKEIEIAIRTLLDRLDNLHVIDDKSDTRYWPGLLHRGVGAVHLGFTPGRTLDA